MPGDINTPDHEYAPGDTVRVRNDFSHWVVGLCRTDVWMAPATKQIRRAVSYGLRRKDNPHVTRHAEPHEIERRVDAVPDLDAEDRAVLAKASGNPAWLATEAAP